MVSTVYVTQNSKYPVHHLTPDGREVILPSNGVPYAIVGFADSSKLGAFLMGSDRYWYLKGQENESLNRGKGEGALEKQLEKIPRIGLQIVAWRVDDKGNYVGPRDDIPDELVSSPLKEILVDKPAI